MRVLSKNLKCECLNFYYLKATRVIIILTVFIQATLSYISTKQILSVGLNAGPETNNLLLEAIPPIQYLGFDSVMFGLLPMTVLGAIYGGQEFKHHSLRTTLLTRNRKTSIFASKFIILLLNSFLIAIISITLTISCTHLSLGRFGLSPVFLDLFTWKNIFLASLYWTLLTVISFAISFFSRTALVSMLFLIPQIYNVGEYLSKNFTIAKYLPVSIGNGLIATSPDKLSSTPLFNIIVLGLWFLFFAITGFIRFHKSDLGGKY